MAGKETAGPHLKMSSGSCNVDQGTSRVPGETREAAWQQPDNQAANRIQVCHVCRFAFTNTEAFQKHAADHSLGTNHSCSKCGKLFVTAATLRRHLLLHGEPSFQCRLCGKTFHRKDGLKSHMLALHFDSQDCEAVEGSP
ncbi:uncharacterized protein LOC142559821 [Dermacentor variabilis]|uniref:uncharacterized protein LOC142559821 n=1 Tax=Dermacentor variabilis TaxID=34621 RepID=UPI003F5C56E5